MSDVALSPSINNTAHDAFESMTLAAREGAVDAREAADRFFDGATLFASRFAYTTCYTLSYGVVFPATLLARSIPKNNAVVRGMIEGAHAAQAKVEEIVTK